MDRDSLEQWCKNLATWDNQQSCREYSTVHRRKSILYLRMYKKRLTVHFQIIFSLAVFYEAFEVLILMISRLYQYRGSNQRMLPKFPQNFAFPDWFILPSVFLRFWNNLFSVFQPIVFLVSVNFLQGISVQDVVTDPKVRIWTLCFTRDYFGTTSHMSELHMCQTYWESQIQFDTHWQQCIPYFQFKFSVTLP